MDRNILANPTARHTVGVQDSTFGYQFNCGFRLVVDPKNDGSPEYQLVVASGFNGMIGINSPKQNARVAKILDALYDDLELGIR
jgi:hypothetical protein